MDSPIDSAYVERVLAGALSETLTPEDVAAIVRRVAAMDEQLAVLRDLPLEAEEPQFLPEWDDLP
jgi:hypothetical protein